MEKVKVYIVEDEAITVAVLSTALQDAGYDVCGSSDNAEHALTALGNNEVDIAILDINLTGTKDGVWLAEQINATSKIPFIYLTSFGDKRTIERAVRTRPYGYLLKPFDDNDIFDSINQAMHNYAQNNVAEVNSTNTLRDELKEVVNGKDYMFIRDKNLFQKVHFKNIQYLQADKNYVDVVTIHKKYTIRTALKDLVPTLPKSLFMQVNRSAVINLNYVDSYNNDTIVIGENNISLTDSFREEFLTGINR